MIFERAVRPSPKIPRRLCKVSAAVAWPRPSRAPLVVAVSDVVDDTRGLGYGPGHGSGHGLRH